MFNIMDSGDYMSGMIFCIFLMIIGKFFLLNLILAVIFETFILI